MELYSMLCASLDRRSVWGKKIYVWLSTFPLHLSLPNIVNQLCSNTKSKPLKKELGVNKNSPKALTIKEKMGK